MKALLAPPLHEDVQPEAKPSGPKRSQRQQVGELERIFYPLGMGPGPYALKVALPLLAAGVAVALVGPLLLKPLAGDLVGSLAPLLAGALVAAMGPLLPFLVRESRRSAVDQQMHVFITHLGVLSTTPMARVDLFATIASKKAYGPLADECAKVQSLVKHWRMSLPQACRFVSARTPSEILSDFLDRLAHALEAGDRLEDYLDSEQAVVMHEYASRYERRLKDLEGFRELFSSLMMSAVFLAVFTMLMPVLTGVDATLLMPLVLLATGGLLGVLLGLARTKSPRDPLWHQLGERNEAERFARRILPAAGALSLAVFAAAWLMGVPVALLPAVLASPLALASFVVKREEEQVRRRDDNYPAFVRNLGAGAAARAGASREAVEQLARHDFGPLTPPISKLHRRLALRINNPRAWRSFALETGSHLVSTFNSMFLEATREGGNAMKIGGLISQNATQMLTLRKQRAQFAGGLRGTLLGMAGALSFTLYLNVGILGLLTDLFTDATAVSDLLPGVGSGSLDLGQVGLFVTLLTFAYALAAGAAIRIVAGGRLTGAFTDMALMLWIAGGTSVAVQGLAGSVF